MGNGGGGPMGPPWGMGVGPKPYCCCMYTTLPTQLIIVVLEIALKPCMHKTQEPLVSWTQQSACINLRSCLFLGLSMHKSQEPFAAAASKHYQHNTFMWFWKLFWSKGAAVACTKPAQDNTQYLSNKLIIILQLSMFCVQSVQRYHICIQLVKKFHNILHHFKIPRWFMEERLLVVQWLQAQMLTFFRLKPFFVKSWPS